MSARSQPLVLALPVSASGATAAGRMLLSATVLATSILIGIAVGGAAAFALHLRSVAVLIGILVGAGMIRLSDEVARRLVKPPEPRRVRIEPDVLSIDGLVDIARADVRECRYDASRSRLLVCGAVGWPLVAFETNDIATAIRVCDALGVPDRDIRTFRALSVPAGLPFVGWALPWLAFCVSSFAFVMSFGGPMRIALPAVLVALPLALVWAPSRIRVHDTQLVRSWLGTQRVVELSRVRGASVRSGVLVLDTESGWVRWRLRLAVSDDDGTAWDGIMVPLHRRRRAVDATLVAVIEARLGTAIARVFE